jgi:thymidylate synthase
MDTFTVSGPDISTAWIRACRALDRIATHRAYHTTVHIEDPTHDDPGVRAELDRVLESKGKQPVRTIANTIFPAALARTASEHAALTDRYKALYPSLARMHGGNRRGTYFGRLIAYPGSKGNIDQIGTVIRRLQQQTKTSRPMTACYEAGLVDPATDLDAEPMTASLPVNAPGVDNSIMSFPCLSHCSFQLDRAGHLHLMALYRSHYMVERAYGNYVGLGELMAHIAHAAGLRVGVLTVVAGYAQLDSDCITRIRPLLAETAPLFAA